MKPAAFEYVRAGSLREAVALLQREDIHARVVAGGQSLGPMLNLRLAQPDVLVDITGLTELTAAEREGEQLYVGACLTHANIEDARLPDAGRLTALLAGIAGGIAYRAVRNRGTLGGSLAHCDPAGDWPCVMPALGAVLSIDNGETRRELPAGDVMREAFEPALHAGEIITGVRIPAVSAQARWGYYKYCRKPGELAEAMAAVLWDPERDILRLSIAALEAPPLVLDDGVRLFGPVRKNTLIDSYRDEEADALLREAGIDDPLHRQVHRVVLRRAVERACA